jgi:hypothetical protein
MNPVCGVILSAVLLGEPDSLSVMPVARWCWYAWEFTL